MSRGSTAYVALGGNLGDPLATMRSASASLQSIGTVFARSSLYATEPVGGEPDQPPYLNAVVGLDPYPSLRDPRDLLAALMLIERLHGRVRRQRWGARTLDLDLLDVAGLRAETNGVTIPHPRMMDRAFVLAPLCEVAPAWRHPVSGEGACEALARLDATGTLGATMGVSRTTLSWRAR